jgi:phosphoglycolate phosphatase-like HAD superfamily hydrolase
METGVNAEVDTIGVSWGFREKKILQKYSPFAISNNTDELKRLISNYI